MNKKVEKKPADVRIPIMVLSAFCGVSLYFLGHISGKMDNEYILLAIITFILCLIEPMVVSILRYYKAKAIEEKLQKEKAERDKILAEKRKKEREAEEAKHAAQMRAELLAASASADDELRVRSDRIRRN